MVSLPWNLHVINLSIGALLVCALLCPQIKADKETSEGSLQLAQPYRYGPNNLLLLRRLDRLNRLHRMGFDLPQMVRRSFPEEDTKMVIRKSGSQDRSKALMMRLFKRNNPSSNYPEDELDEIYY